MKTKILKLTIKKQWFLLIKDGVKKEEYRTIKDYWTKRLVNREYDFVEFRNGYRHDSPKITLEYLGFEIKTPNLEWCPAEYLNTKFYAIKLGEIIK